MIRLRDRPTGAEAEWDQGKWSGDPDFIKTLEMAMRAEGIRPGPSLPNGDAQRRIREELTPPPWHFVVVEETKPPESPRFDSNGVEIVY